MSEYPKDRLYLRLNLLLRELKSYAHDYSNLELYSYIHTIEKRVYPETDYEFIIKSENHILSKEFINQKVIRDTDKSNIKSIIRNYKLNSINI